MDSDHATPEPPPPSAPAPDSLPAEPGAAPEPPVRPHPRRRRRILFALISVLLSLTAGLLILELVFRLLLVRYAESIDKLYQEASAVRGQVLGLRDVIRPSSSDQRVYEFQPGIDALFLGIPLRTNSAGFRDVERSIAKPANTYRIAVLGDSVAFGWGVRAEDRFSNQLEVLLNQGSSGSGSGSATDGTTSASGSRRRYEVLNFALPGYNTVMELATLRDVALKYDPDAVILNMVGNDTELPNFVREKPNLWSLRRSFVWEAARDRLEGLELGYTARQVGGGLVTAPDFREDLVPERYRPLVGWDNAEKALQDMARELKSRGIVAYALVHHPFLNPLLDHPEKPLPDWADPNAPWLKAARQAGFEIVDPLNELVAWLRQKGVRQDALWVKPGEDFHPNPAAHRLLAEILANRIPQQEPHRRASAGNSGSAIISDL